MTDFNIREESYMHESILIGFPGSNIGLAGVFSECASDDDAMP